jgi:hypothetical protein
MRERDKEGERASEREREGAIESEKERFVVFMPLVFEFFLWEFRDLNPRHPAWNGTYRLATGTGA